MTSAAEKVDVPFRSPYLPPLKKLGIGTKLKMNSSVGLLKPSLNKRVIQTTKPLLTTDSKMERKEIRKGSALNVPQKSNLLNVTRKPTPRRSSFGDCNGSSGAEDQADSYELKKKINAVLAENTLLKAQVKKFSTENSNKSKEISQLKASNRSLNQYKDKATLLDRMLKDSETSYKRELLNLRKEIQLLKSQLVSTRRSSVCAARSPQTLLRSKSTIDKSAVAAAKNKLNAESNFYDGKHMNKSTGDLSKSAENSKYSGSSIVTSSTKVKVTDDRYDNRARNKSTCDLKNGRERSKNLAKTANITTRAKNISVSKEKPKTFVKVKSANDKPNSTKSSSRSPQHQGDLSKGALIVKNMPAIKPLLPSKVNIDYKTTKRDNSTMKYQLNNSQLNTKKKPPIKASSPVKALPHNSSHPPCDVSNIEGIEFIQAAIRGHAIRKNTDFTHLNYCKEGAEENHFNDAQVHSEYEGNVRMIQAALRNHLIRTQLI